MTFAFKQNLLHKMNTSLNEQIYINNQILSKNNLTTRPYMSLTLKFQIFSNQKLRSVNILASIFFNNKDVYIGRLGL